MSFTRSKDELLLQRTGIPGWKPSADGALLSQSQHIAGCGAQSPQFGAWNTMIQCWSHLYSENAEFCCLCKRCPVYVLHYCLAGAERLF